MMAQGELHMVVRQEPQRAQVVPENNIKNRKPIDPPPVVELKYDEGNKLNPQWMVSPRTFMVATLINDKDSDERPTPNKLVGQTVSSLSRLKDLTNKDGGFFVFGDISVRSTGTFKLRFSLFDSVGDANEVVFIDSVDSNTFQVLAQREFGSMAESTPLTRTFSDQGVKLRVRKDNRTSSSLGVKRSYNAGSPLPSSSPQHNSNTLYGGPVQDHHYGATTPDFKRQRADSDYGSGLYAPFAMQEPSYTQQYSNGDTIPHATRAWVTDFQSRSSYPYPQQSISSRFPSFSAQSWQANVPLQESHYGGYIPSNNMYETEANEDLSSIPYLPGSVSQ